MSPQQTWYRLDSSIIWLDDINNELYTTRKIKKSPFIKFFTWQRSRSLSECLFSCFVSCIPSLILLNDIIFAILSVMSSWRKNKVKKTKTYQPTWTKSQLECFVVQPGGDNNFYCQSSDLNQSWGGDGPPSLWLSYIHGQDNSSLVNLITSTTWWPSHWQNTNITSRATSEAIRFAD